MRRDLSHLDRDVVLADAAAMGVPEAARKHDLHPRTIERWRKLGDVRASSAARSRVRPAPVAEPSAGPVAGLVPSGDPFVDAHGALAVMAARLVELAAELGPDDFRGLAEATVKIGSMLAQRAHLMRAAGDPEAPEADRATGRNGGRRL